MRSTLALVLLLAACAAKPDAVVVQLSDPPPPISGGTLALLADGHTAVVGDSDRDRVLVVDLASDTIVREIDLPGSEPGRVVQSPSAVHVVLRGSDAVLTFDPTRARDDVIVTHVCAMPRGIAYDDATSEVLVACRSGELASLTTRGELLGSVNVAPDLRDVIAVEGRRFVTTFRRAELLEVNRAGQVLSRRAPAAISIFTGSLETYSASVAWRAIYVPAAHAIAMVHQRGRTTSIPVRPAGPTSPPPSGYGVASSRSITCPSGVVHSAVTMFGLDGTQSDGGAIPDVVLPVDLASDGTNVWIAAAGAREGEISVWSASIDSLAIRGDGCASPPHALTVVAQPTALVIDASGAPLVLERASGSLVTGDRRIALGGASVVDTGHALFHTDTGDHVACASCHPEGGDDGRVWVFDGFGRRSQSLAGGVIATAPFHWDGADATFDAIVDDVLVGRMHGARPTDEAIDAFASWLDAIPAPRSVSADPDAVARGALLFAGRAGCSDCHAGAHLTDGRTVDVGTGGAFQVPSLVGVSARLPVMHDGCAHTLAERFDPICGGERHGATDLDDAERADLVAYLSSL